MTAPAGPADPKPAAPAPAPAPTGKPSPPPPASGTTTASSQATAPPGQPAAAPPRPPAPAKPPRPAKKSSTAAGAYLLAIVALLVAVASGVIGAYAVKTARDARDANAAPLTSTVTVTPPPTSAEPLPTGSTSSSPAPSSSGPQYVPQFQRIEVVVPRPSGCTVIYVDVDTLAVGSLTGHELYLALRPCESTPSDLVLRVDRTSGRSVSAPNPTPQACASLVAGTPTSELLVEVETGLTLCLLTNQADAAAQSLPQRLAIVEVLSAAPGDPVRLAVSTYLV